MKQRKVLGLALALMSLALTLAAQGVNHENNQRGVLYLATIAPVIDGDFAEWQGLEGSTTTKIVYGGEHIESDGQGFFVLWSDNKKLYIYAKVPDSKPNENDFPPPIAWRNDSIEFYIGINTLSHSKYLKDDSQVRIVPRSKADPTAFGLSVNDHELPGGTSAAVVYHADSYEIEAAIPLNFLLIKKFETNQAIRVEFQVNDADNTERDRLMHWSSPKDNTYYDPSSWGDATVLALPNKP